MIINHKLERRTRRKKGIRKRIRGTSNRPRLSVFRSLKHIYAQIIDDTLVSASSLDKELTIESDAKKTDISRAVGNLLAARAQAKGITTVAFDRNGFLYHGRVRALADGAREGGLQF